LEEAGAVDDETEAGLEEFGGFGGGEHHFGTS
jgi:hypothetical protein